MATTLRTAGSVLTDRAYLGYTCAFGFGCGALFCYIAGSPFLLQNVLGFSIGEASVAFSGSALLGTVQSLLGPIVAPLIGIGGSDTAVPLRATARCRRPRRSPPPVRIDSRHSGGRRSPRSHHLLRPSPTRKPWG